MPNPNYSATTWADDTAAGEHWPESPTLTPAARARLLSAATTQAREYAPVLEALTPVPDGWVLAVVYQARELHNAAQRDGDVIGTDVYAVRSRPLTNTVKALLRPLGGFRIG